MAHWRKSGFARYWPPGSRVQRHCKTAGLVIAAILTAGLTANHFGYDLGVSKTVTAFKVAVGLEKKEDETFVGCLKGAAEGAFSSAVPIAEIVAVGELMVASPPLVVMGAGLGCSLGIIKSAAVEGVGWAVHTGSEIIDGVIGR